MRYTLITFFIFLNFISYSQYLGPMDHQLLQSLTKVERDLFDKCVKDCGVLIDSMIWIQIGDSVYNHVRLDDGLTYHYSKRTIIQNSDGEHWTMEDIGSFHLEKPQFLVAIFHYSTHITRVTLLMYY